MEANNLTKHLHPVRDANSRAHINPGKKMHGNAQIVEYRLPDKDCKISGCSACYGANSLTKIRDIDQLNHELEQLESLTGAMESIRKAKQVVSNLKMQS
jgi:hypothetical protein